MGDPKEFYDWQDDPWDDTPWEEHLEVLAEEAEALLSEHDGQQDQSRPGFPHHDDKIREFWIDWLSDTLNDAHWSTRTWFVFWAMVSLGAWIVIFAVINKVFL